MAQSYSHLANENHRYQTNFDFGLLALALAGVSAGLAEMHISVLEYIGVTSIGVAGFKAYSNPSQKIDVLEAGTNKARCLANAALRARPYMVEWEALRDSTVAQSVMRLVSEAARESPIANSLSAGESAYQAIPVEMQLGIDGIRDFVRSSFRSKTPEIGDVISSIKAGQQEIVEAREAADEAKKNVTQLPPDPNNPQNVSSAMGSFEAESFRTQIAEIANTSTALTEALVAIKECVVDI